MIDLKERRRRIKRKFSDPLEEIACTAQPKETILDMSVSKLAKAKTQVNLEPSLRKTVMIVNTIRKIEQEMENGKDVSPVSEERMCVDNYISNRTCPNTRPDSICEENSRLSNSKGTTDNVGEKPMRLGVSVTKRNKQFVCEDRSETLDNRYRSFGVTLATSQLETSCVDLKRTTDLRFKNKLTTKRSSGCFTTVNSELPLLEEEEINFAEIDISLYDFDESLPLSEGGLQLACGSELEDNDNIYKTNTGLSALIRRCSDDLKFTKSTESSLTDDLDQIMQVLVGI